MSRLPISRSLSALMAGNSLHVKDLGLGLDEQEPLDVLDLPQIYTRPSAKSLLDTLSILGIEPRSWDSTPSLTPGTRTPKSRSGNGTPLLRARQTVLPAGVPQYLTSIISSPLAWIETDEEKEQVWEAASVRLSERSGRTGMGALSRTFRIPSVPARGDDDDISTDPSQTSIDHGAGEEHGKEIDTDDEFVDIEIHEPALTEDNLGLKTWASSYVLARKWIDLRHLLPSCQDFGDISGTRSLILELGAGTGLVGIAAAAVFGAHVLLTDLPEIVDNLARNARGNLPSVQGHDGSTSVAMLDWTQPRNIHYLNSDSVGNGTENKSATSEGTLSAPLIVAADPIYSPEHPRLLAQAVSCHLLRSDKARVVVAMPIREAYAEERADFLARFRAIGLALVHEEKNIGYDDWSEDNSEELAEVEVWITIWAWASAHA